MVPIDRVDTAYFSNLDEDIEVQQELVNEKYSQHNQKMNGNNNF